MAHVVTFINESVYEWRANFGAINKTACLVLSKEERRKLSVRVYDLKLFMRSRRKEIERLIDMQWEHDAELQRSLIAVYTEHHNISKVLDRLEEEIEVSIRDDI